MKNVLKVLLIVVFLLWIGLVVVQQLEIIELKCKMVDQVLLILLLLVEFGGMLIGMNNQFFLCVLLCNWVEIKWVLVVFDMLMWCLIICISENWKVEDNVWGGEVSGQVVFGSMCCLNVEVSVWDIKSVWGESVVQMVQIVEGGQVFIQVGCLLLIFMCQVVIGFGGVVINEMVFYKDVGCGFYVMLCFNGEWVILDIIQ